jgi:hypothetical protein
VFWHKWRVVGGGCAALGIRSLAAACQHDGGTQRRLLSLRS